MDSELLFGLETEISGPGRCSLALAVQKVREEGLCPFLYPHILSFCSLEYFAWKASLFLLLEKNPLSALHTSVQSQTLSTNIII